MEFSGRLKRQCRIRNSWLPGDVRETVEAASFWEMVDRENRKHEDGCQVQHVSIHRQPCMEVETKAKEANDRNDEAAENHEMPTTSPTLEGLVEDDGDTHLRIMDADSSDHDDSMSDTRRAQRTRPRRPITVTGVSKIAKKKNRIRRKFATAQATIPAAKIPLGLGMIDVRLVSPLVLLFLFIFGFPPSMF